MPGGARLATNRPEHGRPLRILCIDGGGCKGHSVIMQLQALERTIGQPVRECFDLICGTSIGGIVGMGVALSERGLPACSEAMDQITHKPTPTNEGKALFKRSSAWQMLTTGCKIPDGAHATLISHLSPSLTSPLASLTSPPLSNPLSSSSLRGIR